VTLLEFLVLLVIAGVCGSIGQAISGFTRGGCLVSIALGFIGALFGTWMARTADLPELFMIQVGGQAFPIVWSIIGATAIVLIVGVLSGRRRG